MTQATSQQTAQPSGKTPRALTIEEVGQALSGPIHPDVALQLLNNLHGADLILRQGDKVLCIEDFTKMVSIVWSGLNYRQDSLATRTMPKFLFDERFNEAYQAGRNVQAFPTEVHWRRHVGFWAANHCMNLNGDFVECGVLKGNFAMGMMTYTDFPASGKTLWLLDSFRGIDAGHLSVDEKGRGIGTRHDRFEDDIYDEVCRTFENYDCVRIIRGSIPGTLSELTCEKVAFAHIDMNNTVPEIAAARCLWERMVPGAMTLLDDYAFPLHREQRQAFDAFAAERSIEVLVLPTGQGLYVKP